MHPASAAAPGTVHRARIVALILIGAALLVAGVPFVVGTFWLLVIAVPALVGLRLVLNLSDGAAHNGPAGVGRITALVITGVALLATGVSTGMTVWTSSFGRFMYLEDLGLEGTTAAAVARVTPVDRGLLVFGGILAFLGAAALITAAVQARRRQRPGR